MANNVITDSKTANGDGKLQSVEDTAKAGLGKDKGGSHAKIKERRMNSSAGLIHHQSTLRHPAWTYFHIRCLVIPAPKPPSQFAVDMLSLRQDLSSALNQFLGLTGTAIPVDILKVDGVDAWIRVPREDGAAVHEAVSGWAGSKSSVSSHRWVVKGRDDWLFRLTAGDGHDLFDG